MKERYSSPKLTEKTIKVNYFLNMTGFLDDFNLLGDVYAQSGPTPSDSDGSPGPSDGGGTDNGTGSDSGGSDGGTGGGSSTSSCNGGSSN